MAVFYKYNSPSFMGPAVREKPAVLLVERTLVISPHIIPSKGNSSSAQHDAKTTLAEPHMTGIGDRCGQKYITVIVSTNAVQMLANTIAGRSISYTISVISLNDR